MLESEIPSKSVVQNQLFSVFRLRIVSHFSKTSLNQFLKKIGPYFMTLLPKMLYYWIIIIWRFPFELHHTSYICTYCTCVCVALQMQKCYNWRTHFQYFPFWNTLFCYFNVNVLGLKGKRKKSPLYGICSLSIKIIFPKSCCKWLRN